MGVPGNANALLLRSAAAAGGYQVSRSLRFNSSDSAYLSRTPASAGNRRTWTFSAWVKSSGTSASGLFSAGSNSTNISVIYFASGQLWYYDYVGGAFTTQVAPSARFRDYSAWYHFVVAVDTTQATAANRVKIYVNGTQITTFDTATYPGPSADTFINSANAHAIGRESTFYNNYGDYYLADIHFIDGQALTPSSFTEVSATTGQLIPKAYSGPTPTGNSFWLPFSDNSAATATTLGKDGFLLGNNWTPNNIQVASSSTTNWTSRTSISSGSIWGWSYLSWIFDVNTATGTHSQGAITYSFSPGIPASGSLRLNIGCNVYHDPNVMIAVSINGAGYGTFPGTVAWRTIGWAGGTINSITLQGTNSGNAQALETFLNAIEVNGVQLIDNAAAQNDSLVDTPTSYGTDARNGGEVRGNYCTWNPLKSTVTLSNGNLDGSAGGGWFNVAGTVAVTSGKWYWEVTMNTSTYVIIGVATPEASLSETYGSPTTVWIYDGRGTKQGNGSGNAGFGTDTYGASYGAGDVIGVALDMDNGTLTFYKNNTSQGTAFSTGLSGKTITPWHGLWSSSSSANFGQRPFAYTAPSGFKALCDTNLAPPLVAKPSSVFQTLVWTGDGASPRAITGLDFNPDLVWIKARSNIGTWNVWFDVLRGGEQLSSNQTDAGLAQGSNVAGYVSAYNNNGFTLTSGNSNIGSVNGNTYSYVGWCWDAGTSTVTNTQGSITSSVRANASAGFSIVSWSANNTANQSIGHGLNVTPAFIIHKNRTTAGNWNCWFTGFSNDEYINLNGTGAKASTGGGLWYQTPTSSLFYIGFTGSAINNSTDAIISYCFAPVAGYSNGFSYTGNGSTDGVFVYLGLRAKLLLIKRTDTTGNWYLWDTVRNTYNVVGEELYPNLSNAAATATDLDILSNGFKMRSTAADFNASGGTYIGFAWAEAPFAYSRAR